MKKYVIDSFAWMEFFKGTPRGKKVKGILEDNKTKKYTTAANYYELYYRLTQEKGAAMRNEALTFIKSNATLLDVTEEIASTAGEIRLTEELNAIDAFTLAAARRINAHVLTGDKDFEKIKETEMI